MVGKCSFREFRRLVADVEVDIIETAFFHLGVDGARHDVARRQFDARIICLHETRACRSAGSACGSLSNPPSPRTASLIRKDFAYG